jgi:DNA-binding SARP family transcriptional activator
MLGPIEAINDDGPIRFGGTKQRAALGFLLLKANQVVSTSQLLNALWDVDGAPASARKILHNAIWGLRVALSVSGRDTDSVSLLTQAPGYTLQVDPEQVDLFRFHNLAERGRAQLAGGSSEQASRSLREALALWRGHVLADLVEAGVMWPELIVVRSARLDALEDYFEAELAAGHHQEMIGELEAMSETETLRERSCGQLMLALYRCGRQADALNAYGRMRSTLVQDLGLEPGRQLQLLQQAILRHDSALTPIQIPEQDRPIIDISTEHTGRPNAHTGESPRHDNGNADGSPGSHGAAQNLGPVVGREWELDLLRGLLDRAWHRAMPHMVTVLGEPGVGKTRFIREFQHRVGSGPEAVAQFVTADMPPRADVNTSGFAVHAALLASYCGISGNDTPAAVWDKLALSLRRLPVTDYETERLLIRLHPLVAPGGDPDHAYVLPAWTKFLGALALNGPLVVVVDQLHRADDPTLDTVENLAESCGDMPLLVVVTARSELLRRRPGWSGGRPHTATITLDPVSDAGIDRQAELTRSTER